jgi:hypothetical protein
MYRPQDNVGSIKAGFTRNYSQDEVNALKSYVASHTGSIGSLVDRLSGAGIPLQDIATLTKAVGQGQGVAGMMSQMGKAPNTGVDMGGGYGGVATRQGPYTPSATNPGALAGLASQMPSRMPSNAQYMDDRIPRVPSSMPMPNRIPQSAMFDDPSYGVINPGSSITQMLRDLQPQQPGSYGNHRDYDPPTTVGPQAGGYNGFGGMFPDNRFPTERIPERQPHPPRYDGYDYPQPIIPSLPPSEYMVDPYDPDPGYRVDPSTPDYNQMMPPRAPNDGISDEYYHGDPLGALIGQIQNDRVPRDQPIPIGEAMKRGGAVDISNHPTLVRMALSNRR